MLALVPPDEQPSEHTLYLKGIAIPLRLVIQRIPPEKVVQQRQRVTRKAGKAGHRIDPRTLAAAGYLMLITSLAAAVQSAERIVSLYRNRLPVELGFKRLKSIDGIDALPALDPDLARTWLLAHLIVAVMTNEVANEVANEIVGFSPSAA